MLSPRSSEEALRRLFRRQPVNELAELLRVLKTTSRVSVFRRLKVLGYLSSFTHGGRFYTLEELLCFDQRGLWFHRDVGFSRAGRLKATVVELVEGSSAGMTPKELVALLKLPVPGSLYDTLRELVGSRRVRRQKDGSLRLYLSADAARGEEQLAERRWWSNAQLGCNNDLYLGRTRCYMSETTADAAHLSAARACACFRGSEP